jgi:hypothetical protein
MHQIRYNQFLTNETKHLGKENNDTTTITQLIQLPRYYQPGYTTFSTKCNNNNIVMNQGP